MIAGLYEDLPVTSILVVDSRGCILAPTADGIGLSPHSTSSAAVEFALGSLNLGNHGDVAA